MVISSGLPYTYHTSSWAGSETGKFRFAGQEIQPSSIHFEETMFALKSEYNRVINKESGYRSKIGAPYFFFTNIGRFHTSLNNRMSGVFDPNPSGAYLGGILPLTHFSINAGGASNLRRPGAIHQKIYIESMRLLCDFILETYGAQGGAWATGATTPEDTSGTKVDWLNIYKGYTDNYAGSGLWFLGGAGEDSFRSGLYDRHLDEVRLQPMPFFGLDTELSMNFLDHTFPWGNTKKTNNDDWPVIRPRYLMSDGSLPSGWPSGLEIGRDNTASPGTGIGGYLVSGVGLALSGISNIYFVSGIYGSPLQNDTRPDSPSYCALTNLKASGSDIMSSGQYRIFLVHPSPTQTSAFPWGTGLSTHRSAQWPFEGRYEPINGILQVSAGDFFDTNIKNESFWITNHMYVIQNDHGGTFTTPRLTSGVYWFQLNTGPSNSIALLDSWTIENETRSAQIAGQPYHSGINALWGLTKDRSARTQEAVGGIPVQFLTGQGWDFDRTNNYYVKVGNSGLSLSSTQQSGVYVRFNQQMKFIDGGVLPRATKGSIEWYVHRAYRAVEDGTNKWLLGCSAGSGSTTDPLASDTIRKQCWLRLDSSFAIQDGLINANYWPVYLRSKSEYVGVWDGVSAVDSEIINGGTGSIYYELSSITWGNLSTDNSAGSGSFTATQRTMTYDSSVAASLNLATPTAQSRIHIGTFFETEDDNKIYCTLLGFASGQASGTTDNPDYWIAKVDASSHPFNVTKVWRLGSVGTFYSNAIASLQVADADIGSAAHMEIHING